MDIKDLIFYDFKLTKAKHKKITNFWVIWPQCVVEEIRILKISYRFKTKTNIFLHFNLSLSTFIEMMHNIFPLAVRNNESLRTTSRKFSRRDDNLITEGI